MGLQNAQLRYIDCIQQIFPFSKLVIDGVVKNGMLMVRSQNLKIWRNRGLEIHFQQGRLLMIKDSERKHDKVLDLNKYMLDWIGWKDKRYCFRIKSVNCFSKYPKFLIGSKDKEVSLMWFGFILVCKNTYYSNTIQKMENETYFDQQQIDHYLYQIQNHQKTDDQQNQNQNLVWSFKPNYQVSFQIQGEQDLLEHQTHNSNSDKINHQIQMEPSYYTQSDLQNTETSSPYFKQQND